MKGTHIAIFSAPGPSHVHPTLSVLATLLRRGYRVSYVTSERFAAEVSTLGAEVLRCPRIEFPFDQDVSENLPIEHQYSRDRVNLAVRTLPLVSSFYEQHRPDLILYDTCAYAGLVTAARIGVPAIRTSPQFAYDEDNLRGGVIPEELRTIELTFNDEADEFYRAHGVMRNRVIFDRAEPTVYFYTPELQLNEHPDDRHSIYAGRCAAERPYPKAWRPRNGNSRGSVLVTASTVYAQGPQYYRKCVEAVVAAGRYAMLSIGSNNDPSAFAPLPEHCEIIRGVPQLAMMPHVEMLIGLGGMSTTMEAMYHGVPMIMLTHGFPEPEAYAQNAQDRGLGVHLRKGDDDADSIRRAILQIAEDSALHGNLARMQRLAKRSPGGEDVANWLEDKLELAHSCAVVR